MSKLVQTGNSWQLIQSGTFPVVRLDKSVVFQSVPAVIPITASVYGGYSTIFYNWNAYFADGTSASQFLTGSGSRVSFLPATPKQSFKIFVTASDSDSPPNTSVTNMIVTTDNPPALIAPSPSSTADKLVSTATSASISFNTASGGYGNITYTMALEGTGSLSTTSGRSATITNLTTGDISRVTLTCTDSYNQTATATYVVGVGVPAIFDEGAYWNTIQSVDFTTLGSGTASCTADSQHNTITVDGFTMGINAALAGGRGSIVLDSSGLKLTMTSGTGTALSCDVLMSLANFSAMENILVDMIIDVPSITSGRQICTSIGDGTHYRSGDSFGMQFSPSATDVVNMIIRKWQSSAATTYTDTTGATITPGSWAVQILLIGQRFGLITWSPSSNYIDGPSLGKSVPMHGTYAASAGGTAPTAAVSNTVTSPLSSLRLQTTIVNGAFNYTLKKARVRRLSRPPST
jgi:hypothetical protein